MNRIWHRQRDRPDKEGWIAGQWQEGAIVPDVGSRSSRLLSAQYEAPVSRGEVYFHTRTRHDACGAQFLPFRMVDLQGKAANNRELCRL
jgi:hypothetical protein